MLKLKDGSPVKSRDGEYNQYHYEPLGVGIVISPFNFPLAIMAGTAAAAIVTGNTILLKPADAAPVVAAKFVEVMKEAVCRTACSNSYRATEEKSATIWLSIQRRDLCRLQAPARSDAASMNAPQKYSR